MGGVGSFESFSQSCPWIHPVQEDLEILADLRPPGRPCPPSPPGLLFHPELQRNEKKKKTVLEAKVREDEDEDEEFL